MPIVTTNSSPAGRRRRVRAATVGDPDFPNKPSGLTQLTDVQFVSAGGATNWGFDRNYTFPTGTAGPYNDSSLALKIQAGIVNGGGGLGGPNVAMANTTTRVYSCHVFKLSANFQMHPIETKFLYPYKYTDATTGARCYIMNFKPYGLVTSGQCVWELQTQPVGATNQNFSDNLTTQILDVDQWYRLEMVLTQNTPGSANGTAEWWTSAWNGSSWNSPVKNASHTTCEYAGPSEYGAWRSWAIDVYHGGNSASPTVPEDQFVYVNRSHVSYGVA